MSEKVFGIDFGTTNTVIYMCENGLLKQVLSCSSSVRYLDNVLIFGTQDNGSIFSLKRFLGSNQKFFDHTPEEIYLDLFRYFLDVIKSTYPDLSDKVKTVLTIPTYFDEKKRSFMKTIAESSGFTVLKILNEPTAALFGYNVTTEGTYCVYDFGGGTFDCSIISFNRGVYEVLGTSGDLFFGGDDIDEALLSYIENTFNLQRDSEHFLKNKNNLEKLKIDLSNPDITELLHFNFYNSGTVSELSLNRKTISAIITKLLNKTVDMVKVALTTARLKNFDKIFFVGGSSQFSILQKLIKDEFNLLDEQCLQEHPNSIVAIGAAKYADNIVNSVNKCLIDVTPLTLGIEVYGGFMDPIIRKNSKIPIEKTEIYTKQNDSQSSIKINILQGEREFVDKCTSLGVLILRNIPKGKTRIYITFKIDFDGLLSVIAKVNEEEQTLTINPIHGLTKSSLASILVRDASEGEEDIKKRLLQTTLLRAQNISEYMKYFLNQDNYDISDDDRNKILELLSHIENNNNITELLKIVNDLEFLCIDFANKLVSSLVKNQ